MGNEAQKITANLKTFFSNAWTKLKPEVKAAGEQALEAFEQKLTPDAINLMDDAVQYTATIGLSDVAAREAAIAKFVQDGTKAGVDVASFAKNELNALVEISVIAVKAKITASTTVAAANENPAPADTHTINSPGVAL